MAILTLTLTLTLTLAAAPTLTLTLTQTQALTKAWLRGDPCGDAPYYCGEKCNGWYGVASCWGPGGHVRKLDLRGAQLKGTLPSQIGLLTELATLED